MITAGELMDILKRCNKDKPVIVASTIIEAASEDDRLLKKAVFSHIDSVDCLSPDSVCNAAVIRVSAVILKA